MEAPIVILDESRPEGFLYCFAKPLGVIRANHAVEIPSALTAIDAALVDGKHVAGYLSYEAGYALEPRLARLLPVDRQGPPLVWFGVFDAPTKCREADQWFRENVRGRAYAGPLQPEWTEAAYKSRFARVHAWIAAGDIYQANLTFRSRFHFAGDPLALYSSLRASAVAAHCAYVDDGERQILSLSPELFFVISPDGRITAKPMKGTAPRGESPAEDAAASAALQVSKKERAENLMIVDLVRNDVGRIAEIGSVAVEKLFAVETYPTLHQMVSTVTARLNVGTRATEVIQALFQCGSVVGVPKIRAMEINRELESSKRGVYCGAIGHFAPDGSASFNVAIRTLTICGYHGELGVGSAVVYDSTAEAEYAECLLKARYFDLVRQPLQLIETLRWSPSDGFVRLKRHLERMANSAAAFRIDFCAEEARQTLEKAVANADSPLRVRLVLSEDGPFECTRTPPGEIRSPWRYMISPERISSTDVLLRHKTNCRELFETQHAQAVSLGYDETVFLNENGQVTEGSRSNIFALIGGELLTPPLHCGLLNGCFRQELIDTGQCIEAPLSPSDLVVAQEIYFGNSLHGLIRASD